MPFAPPSPPCIVLDTNVCLDLWWFADSRCARLRAALQAGAVQAVTRSDCRDEWLRVLSYPALALDADQRTVLVAAFDAQVRCIVEDPAAPSSAATPLPRCADADDQKFMQLAQSAGARWLLSRDLALLRLDRCARRAAGFAILRPQDWTLDTALIGDVVEHGKHINRSSLSV